MNAKIYKYDEKIQSANSGRGHSLGLAFYGAAAIAYNRVGINEKPEVYDLIAAEECAKMEAALRAVAVENEPNPAKIKWYCEK